MITKGLNIKFNWPLVGNSHIIDFLSRSMVNNRLAHTYIFLGPDNLGKTTVADYFAKSLLCQGKREEVSALPCGQCSSCLQFKLAAPTAANRESDSLAITHGDYHLLKKDRGKKNISIDRVRDLIKTLGLSSFLGTYKIGIIKGADSLSAEAANALLKILEEPKDKVVIILISSSLESLPATIVSRSQILNFYPVKADVIYDYLIKERGASRSMAKNLSRLCLGRPALAIKFLENKNFFENYLAQAGMFLDFINQDVNERWENVAKLSAREIAGPEAAEAAAETVEIWRGLARDLILLNLGQVDLIQHGVVLEKLEKIKNKFTLDNLLRIVGILRLGNEYLKANVKPKAVLENVVVNI